VVILFIHLSVGLSAKLHKKLQAHWLKCSYKERLNFAQLGGDLILVAIQISI